MNDASEATLKKALIALDRMQAKLDAAEGRLNEPVAILGMACRFPGAPDVNAFWNVLYTGKETVGPVPPERWDAASLYDSNPDTPGKMSAPTGGFLDRVDQFDAQFFRISPREAACMDPQQRLILEVAWEALESAGIAATKLSGSRSGVFIGITLNDYGHVIRRAGLQRLDSYFATGNCLNVTAGRLSYFLGLQGPSMAIDTACSSSLVAVHTACQSLRAGECDLAIVGGVNLILSPEMSIAMSKNHTMAPDGHCKPFSAAADGYVRGEGCGVVVLKRLRDAQDASDPILALIPGSAISHGGKGSGLTVPNRRSQEDLIRRALANAGVKPNAIGYVETHGTGTSLGDPIEMRALGAVLREGRSNAQPCRVGSLKANIGHLESAAGLAGLIKAVLSLTTGTIPPQIHCETVNPDIPLESLSLAVPTAAEAWPAAYERRIAGVSSFGFSGTIAHVIVEEAPKLKQQATEQKPRPYLLPLSAKNKPALQELSEKYEQLFTDSAVCDRMPVRDICYTAAARRAHHESRLAVLGTSHADFAAALGAFRQGEPAPSVISCNLASNCSSGPVFVFSGQGSQYEGMVRHLLRSEEVFRDEMQKCARTLEQFSNLRLMQLFDENAAARLDEIDVIQPALFAVQVSLAALWRSWGVEPAAVVGHSMGEVAAAHIAGVLTLEDAARVICARGRLLRRLRGQGAMAMAELTRAEAEMAIADFNGLSVAACNGPRSIVLAGDPAPLQTVLENLQIAGKFCRLVKVDVASHSPQVDVLLNEMIAAVTEIIPNAATVPFYSTVTGEVASGLELDAIYWARNLRQTVQFHNAIEGIVAAGFGVFLELSPHPILTPSIEQTISALGVSGAAYPSLRRGEDDGVVILQTLASLYTAGVPVDWNRVYPNGRCVSLPSYPWQRERHWIETEPIEAEDPDATTRPLLGHRRSARLTVFEFESRYTAKSPAFLSDHVIYKAVVVPGASHLILMRAAFEECFGAGACVLEDVCFPEALVFAGDESRIVRTVVKATGEDSATIEVSSLQTNESRGIVHATARMRRGAAAGNIDISAVRRRCGRPSSAADFYKNLRAVGYELGTAFQWISEVWNGQSEAFGLMKIPQGLELLEPGAVHPALMDSCLQLMCGALPSGSAGMLQYGEVFAPFAIERIEFHSEAKGELWCNTRLRNSTSEVIAGDLDLVTEGGQVIASVHGLQLKRAGRALLEAVQERDIRDWLYQIDWRTSVRNAGAQAESRTWVIFGRPDGLGARLSALLEEKGNRCFLIDADRLQTAGAEPIQQVLRTIVPLTRHSASGIVYLAADFATAEPHPVASIQRLQDTAARRALHLGQALVGIEWPRAPRLWLVTRGIHAIDPDDLPAPAQSTIWGLGAGLTAEFPELVCTRIDIDGAADDAAVCALVDELLAPDSETQIALRKSGRRVARVVPLPPEPSLAFTPGRPVELEISQRGLLDNLVLRPVSRRPPGAGEVEIETATTSLNLRDILNALGRGYPVGWPFGFECAGRITAVGTGVDNVRVGDEVIAFTPSSFRSFVTTRAEYVAKKPRHLSITDASTIFAPFATAQYAFHDLARVTPGERVLIHAAAGGTGLALVQTALNAGCEVFVTASPSKWDFLRQLGVRHVMNSRSLDFAREIMEQTGGEGIDVVVNSLAGEFIPKSFSVLRSNGRFLEMGKTDIWEHSDVEREYPHVSYLPFNLVDLCLENPSLAARLIREVLAGFEAGRLQPLPATVFPIEKTVDAFRYMAQARHIGRIVVAWDSSLKSTNSDRVQIHSDATYLITGGTGGLGIEVAQWLAHQGARHLVLVARRAPAGQAESAIGELSRRGVHVRVRRADVSQPQDIAAIIAEIDAGMPPLRGVIHAAGVLDDATVLQCDWARFRAVLDPKVAGSWNLHEFTRNHRLDFFVLFSGAAGMLGLAGQANYVAANAFLDALAPYRRSLGLPCMSINWSAWSSVGLAAARAERGERLAKTGIGSISPKAGLRVFEQLLNQDRPNVAVIPWDVAQWRQHYPAQARTPFYSEINAPGVEQSPADTLAAKLADADPRRRTSLLEQFLQEQAARVLRLSPSRIERLTPFNTLGFDSLMALELRNRLEMELKIPLSATLVWAYPTVVSLARHLAEKLQLPLDAEPEQKAEPAEQSSEDGALERVLDGLLTLSDDQAAALLESRAVARNAAKG